MRWKETLVARRYASSSVNVMLASVNGLLSFAGRPDWRVKFLKRQRSAFRDERRELERGEYAKLVARRAARKKKTSASSWRRYARRASASPNSLRNGRGSARGTRGADAQRQMPPHTIPSGARAQTPSLRGVGENFPRPALHRQKGKSSQPPQSLGRDEKARARAGVAASKVFPHNLRHLFARTYYALSRDLSKLADLLGHSSVETTRLYIITAGGEHLRQLNKMKLVM